MLYPENISSRGQLRLLTAYLADANSKLVPFIAVDQEGGRVQRLDRRTGHTHYPSAQKMGRDATLTPEEARRIYGEMAKELAGAGINLNFGPVVDLSLNPWNAVDRTPQAELWAGSQGRDVARPLLHRRPSRGERGHRGKAFSRSRLELERQPQVAPRYFAESWQRESSLSPMSASSHDGLLDMVMVGHLYHPRFSDGEQAADLAVGERDTSASGPTAISAIAASWSATTWRWVRCATPIHWRSVVILALNAGVDLLVFSNVKSRDTDLGVRLHEIIANAVRDGRIPRARIEAAYERIAALKHRLMAA